MAQMTKEELLEKLLDALDLSQGVDAYIGRSKYNQYGRCRLSATAIQDLDLLSDAGVDDDVLSRRVYYVKRNILKSLIRSIPYDKHYLPSCLLSKKPRYIVKYGTMTLEGSSALCTNVVVLNATRDVASLRRIDRSRFRLIREREKRLFARFNREYRVVEKAWKDAFPYMTSTEFWERYLNMA